MGSRIRSLLGRLWQLDTIRAQVLTDLFIVRIHNLIKSSYEDHLASSSEFHCSKSGSNREPTELEDRFDLSCWRERCSGHTIKQTVSRREYEEKEEEDTTTAFSVATNGGCRRRSARWALIRDQEDAGRDAGTPYSKLKTHESERAWDHKRADHRGQNEWDWRGFPELWPPFKWHQLASTSWMTWAIVRTLFLNQLEDLISPATQYFFGMPGNCLLPGRLALPLGVSPLFTALLAFYQVAWRSWQGSTKRNRLISMVVFLLASERDLERFYEMLESNCNQSSQGGCLPGGSEWATSKRTNPITGAGKQQQQQQQQQPVTQSGERLFLDAMCYQVSQSNRSCSYFKLRSNRTPEARARLVRRVTLTNLIMATGFCALFFPSLVCMQLIAIYSDYRYAHVYRNCYPPLEGLRASGQLEYFTWSGGWNWHHVLSGLIFDLFENIFLWGDSCLSLFFIPTFAYLLNYDLLLHWSGIEVKLENLLGRVKHQFLVSEEHPQQQQQQQQVASSFCNYMSLRPNGLFGKNGDAPKGCYDNSMSYREHPKTSEQRRRLEADIREVQFEVCDFFHQVERADGLVGDIVTTGILIWLTSLAFVCCNQLLYDTEQVAYIIGFVIGLGCCAVSLSTFHLMELRRCCLKSHRVLCSLMAYDQSRHKRTFGKLLEYYTSNRTNYHLLRTYAYKPTTFITMIGWSFSCCFVAYTLFGPQSSMPAGSQDNLSDARGE